MLIKIHIIWDDYSNNETWKFMYYEDRPPKYKDELFVSSKVCHYICMFYLIFY